MQHSQFQQRIKTELSKLRDLAVSIDTTATLSYNYCYATDFIRRKTLLEHSQKPRVYSFFVR